MIILPHDIIESLLDSSGTSDHAPISLVSLDEGDAYVHPDLTNDRGKGRASVEGILKFSHEPRDEGIKELPAGVGVMVVARLKDQENTARPYNSGDYQYDAWVSGAQGVEPRPVKIIKFNEEIFSRIHGLYETDVLKSKRVLIVGVGSGGSAIAIELAKAGVGNFMLIDHDRLEVANVVRHLCGLSDLGRFKTKAVKDQILDKNPSALVETFEEQCDWNYLPKLKDLARRSDIIFCCTDNRASRVLVNLASVSERRVCIYGGTFNRAYGGHVLRVTPGETMCYQCFIDILPEKAEDQEIASQAQADSVAYDDRPVPVEPGLANDIAPIAIMSVKLGILEMLRGTETTLSSLYEDLSHAWYQWLNRREAGTDYASLKPMDSEESDDLRILAWYGIANERDLGCPVCGDFVGSHLGAKAGDLSRKQIDAFGADPEDTSDDEGSFPPD